MQKEVYKFISKQIWDPIVEWRTCTRTGEKFPIFQSEKKLLESYAPVINGRKYSLPLPSQSPRARNIQRMLFRNDRSFYKGKSDHDGNSIISIYPPWTDATVYEVNSRYQDFWNPMSYTKDWEERDDVFDVMWKLIKKVPRLNVDGIWCENSDYCNYCGYDKNCYMDIAGENNEDCYYCLFTKYSKRCADCTFVYNSEFCYEAISCYDCNKLVYCQYIENSHDCYFSFDLKNCSHCLRCWNLRNQNYCIMNKQFSKEEYHKIIDQIINGTYSGYQVGLTRFHELRKNFIYPAFSQVNTEWSIGNNVKDMKNSSFTFNALEIEDSHYLYDVMHAKNCLDLNYSLFQPESSYQLMSTLELKQSICNVATHHSHHVYYCQLCNNSAYLFGCVGLNNKQYCIFNKQYSKDEYFVILAKILKQLSRTGQRWRYFPSNMSFHPYNDTVAWEYYPISSIITHGQEQVVNIHGEGKVTLLEPEKFISPAILDLGGEEKIPIMWRTKNEEVNISSDMKTISSEDLPDNICNTNVEIMKTAIFCQDTGRPYRIVWPEYRLYQKLNIPLPRKHHDVRHLERMKLRPWREIYLRNCDKTWKEILSIYPSDAPFKVYSEEAWRQEIYG